MNILPASHAIHWHQDGLTGPVYFFAAIKRRAMPVQWYTLPPLFICYAVAYTTAAALVHELMEARDERRLRALQKHLNTVKRLIVDELGYVPFTAVGSELLFDVFSQRYERGSTLVTSNLPFDEWTSVFGSERLTGELLDRPTHHVHILEMNGESYRLATSKKAQRRQTHAPQNHAPNAPTKTISQGDAEPK